MDTDSVYGGHGTHVAGIIGAVGNNGVGVAGVNWTSSIMAVKWLDSESAGSTSDLLSALQMVVTAKQAGVNVRVVNDSSSFPGTASSQALESEISTLGANNILFVTAAGNSGEDDDTTPRYPCSYDLANEICVAASDQNDQLAQLGRLRPEQRGSSGARQQHLFDAVLNLRGPRGRKLRVHQRRVDECGRGVRCRRADPLRRET